MIARVGSDVFGEEYLRYGSSYAGFADGPDGPGLWAPHISGPVVFIRVFFYKISCLKKKTSFLISYII